MTILWLFSYFLVSVVGVALHSEALTWIKPVNYCLFWSPTSGPRYRNWSANVVVQGEVLSYLKDLSSDFLATIAAPSFILRYLEMPWSYIVILWLAYRVFP